MCVQNNIIITANASMKLKFVHIYFSDNNCLLIQFSGSPEMAFVHALAAAGAASFVARACRDGQLTSCGCSRSARPRQLHDDWTWGGCGDDLEFGYK